MLTEQEIEEAIKNKEVDIMERKVEELTAVLACMVHKNGGVTEITPQDLQSIPDKMFSLSLTEQGNLLLKFTDLPE